MKKVKIFCGSGMFLCLSVLILCCSRAYAEVKPYSLDGVLEAPFPVKPTPLGEINMGGGVFTGFNFVDSDQKLIYTAMYTGGNKINANDQRSELKWFLKLYVQSVGTDGKVVSENIKEIDGGFSDEYVYKTVYKGIPVTAYGKLILKGGFYYGWNVKELAGYSDGKAKAIYSDHNHLLRVLRQQGEEERNKETSGFIKKELGRGVTIEIPSHWGIVDADSVRNLEAMSSALASKEGIPLKKTTLLAVNATPMPTGAMIRVSASSPLEYTQDELARPTSKDLQALESTTFRTLTDAEDRFGLTIKPIGKLSIDKVCGLNALAFSYQRGSQIGPSLWKVTQYKIPLKTVLLELTLSYRESDGILWKSILEHVKHSLMGCNIIL